MRIEANETLVTLTIPPPISAALTIRVDGNHPTSGPPIGRRLLGSPKIHGQPGRAMSSAAILAVKAKRTLAGPKVWDYKSRKTTKKG